MLRETPPRPVAMATGVMLRGAEPELGGEVGSGRGSWAVLPRCKERGPAAEP